MIVVRVEQWWGPHRTRRVRDAYNRGHGVKRRVLYGQADAWNQRVLVNAGKCLVTTATQSTRTVLC